MKQVNILPKELQPFVYLLHTTEAPSLRESLEGYVNVGEQMAKTIRYGAAFLLIIGVNWDEEELPEIGIQNIILLRLRLNVLKNNPFSGMKKEERLSLRYSILSALILIDDIIYRYRRTYAFRFEKETGLSFDTTIQRAGQFYHLTGATFEMGPETLFEFRAKNSEPIYFTKEQLQNKQS